MKRRDFLKKTGIASVGLISPAYLGAMSPSFSKANNTINIGVIGTGSRGQGLTSIINDIDRLNVTAVCDVIPFRLAEGLSRANEKTIGYTDYREVLDNKDIDAVIVATPLDSHAQIAMDALDAGKHVYCEKTLAKGYDAIGALVRKAQQHPTSIFQTGHQYHSSRLYTEVVTLIKEGTAGTISAIDCQWNRNGSWRRPVPDPKLERAINWRMYREYSGGLVAELSSHQIDFANWVVDQTPTQVVGTGGIDYWKDGRETFDNVHLIYAYPNGVKATFTCLTNNAKDGYQIKVHGSKGTFIIGTKNAWFYPEGRKNITVKDVDGVSGATAQWDAEKGYPLNLTHLNPSKQALLDFKQAIVNNIQPDSNIITGAKAAIAVQMGLDTMYQNKVVTWNNAVLQE